MNNLPDEISNHICSYIESPTNKLIRDLYFDPIACLKINRKYNFKHVNIDRLLKAIHTKCPHCSNRINPQEYLYRGLYEKITRNKLCFDCIGIQKYKLVFEISELSLMIIITFYMWLSILHFVNVMKLEIK